MSGVVCVRPIRTESCIAHISIFNRTGRATPVRVQCSSIGAGLAFPYKPIPTLLTVHTSTAYDKQNWKKAGVQHIHAWADASSTKERDKQTNQVGPETPLHDRTDECGLRRVHIGIYTQNVCPAYANAILRLWWCRLQSDLLIYRNDIIRGGASHTAH